MHLIIKYTIADFLVGGITLKNNVMVRLVDLFHEYYFGI